MSLLLLLLLHYTIIVTYIYTQLYIIILLLFIYVYCTTVVKLLVTGQLLRQRDRRRYIVTSTQAKPLSTTHTPQDDLRIIPTINT